MNGVVGASEAVTPISLRTLINRPIMMYDGDKDIMQKGVLQEKRTALLNLSHELGREDRSLAIIGEGNVSARISRDYLLVKASGSSMRALQEQDLVQCKTKRILPLPADIADDNVEKYLLACRTDSKSKKPSIETLFHAYLLSLPEVEFVAHTHPLAVNQILCSPMARAFAKRRLFPDQIVYCGMLSLFIPYVDPGLPLAQAIRQRTNYFIDKYEEVPSTILLENHGLIALGSTIGDVLSATLMMEKAARIFVGAAGLAGPNFLRKDSALHIGRRPDEQYRRRLVKS